MTLQPPPSHVDSVFTLSILLEAMGDLGIEPTDPIFSWKRITARLSRRYYASGKHLYADLVSVLMDLRNAPLTGPDADEDEDEYIPF